MRRRHRGERPHIASQSLPAAPLRRLVRTCGGGARSRRRAAVLRESTRSDCAPTAECTAGAGASWHPLSHVIDSSGISGPAPGSTQHVPRLVLGRAGNPRRARSGRAGRGSRDSSGTWRASGQTFLMSYWTGIQRHIPRLAPHDRFHPRSGRPSAPETVAPAVGRATASARGELPAQRL